MSKILVNEISVLDQNNDELLFSGPTRQIVSKEPLEELILISETPHTKTYKILHAATESSAAPAPVFQVDFSSLDASTTNAQFFINFTAFLEKGGSMWTGYIRDGRCSVNKNLAQSTITLFSPTVISGVSTSNSGVVDTFTPQVNGNGNAAAGDIWEMYLELPTWIPITLHSIQEFVD